MSDAGFSVSSHLSGLKMLMIVERTVGGLVHPATIEELYMELNKVIDDFDRAVNIEVLRLAQKNGQHPLSQFDNG